MDCMEEDKQLVFLYRAVEGVAKSLHAIDFAARCGLPDRVVKRAQDVRFFLFLHEIQI